MSNKKLDKKSCKYIIYARKSTEAKDKQVQSIDDQIRIMKERAKRDSLTIVKVISEAKSGGHPGTRPGFAKMVQMIEDGDANGILTWKLDRISRNPLDSGYIHQMMNDGKLSWILTDGRDYNEDDDLLFDVESSMDAKYRKDLMVNVRRGLSSKADKGWRPHMAPIGYLNDRTDKTIIPDPDNWDLVRKVFDKYLTGTISPAQLTNYAKEIGLRTHRRKQIGGKPLTSSGLRSMLTNVFYTGKYEYADKDGNKRIVNGNHPPMITMEEHERILELLGGKHNNRPQKDPYSYLFRGTMKCATCGFAIVTEKHKKTYKSGKTQEFVYCRCSGKCRDFHCPQSSINIPEKELVEQVKAELAKYTIDQRFFDLAIEALAEEEDRRIAGQEKKIRELRRQEDAKKNELSGLRRMRYCGEITDQAWFIEESNNLEGQIKAIQDSIARVEVAEKRWRDIANDVFMFARYAKEDFDSDDLERKQYVLKALGAELKLSGRTIIFSPVKYLIPIEKAVKNLNADNDLVRTCSQQRKNDPEGSNNSTWCWK
ncbi:recombinase family protein [Candidatus Saccharibacteria bacterium]|nr:recombinase family protein [Candidatus Saccharibacteria bacterium]